MLDLTLIPASLKESTQTLWQQYEAAAGEQRLKRIADAASVEFSTQLTRAFTGSEFIAKTLISNPQILLELVEFGALEKAVDQLEGPLAPTTFKAQVKKCSSETELDSLFRQFRQRAMVRLIWRDFNRLANLQETTADISALADLVIALAMDFHYRQLCEKHGTPIGKHSGTPQSMVVLGMGKLGAYELNVSSDIDLIFAYPESGVTRGGRKELSNQEFFVRLGQRLIKTIDATTAEGFVFRVDMRLRPYGQSGPLVMNFDSMEEYYQTQGRDWERFAMIKARPVAGEEAAADQLMRMLRPFTYRQYIDFSAIEALRATKALINREVQRKGMAQDVKLGFGGIREVEFIVQAFQLIRGGRDPRLQERQLLKLLPLLESEGYLPDGVGTELSEAYIVLRNTEHAIQGYQDRQTQALPADDRGLLRLAWVMGYGSWAAFELVLNRHREVVNGEFQAVIADPEEERESADSHLEEWAALWTDTLAEEQARALLQDNGFEEPERVQTLLKQLRESRQVTAMQSSSRDRLEAFVPRMLAALANTRDSAQTLSRIMVLVEAVVRRSAYLVLLVENPSALQQLVRLCAASPWIADQLAKYPALLDELLDARSLYAPPDKAELRDELRQEVIRLAWDDLEGHMEALRYYRLAHSLRVAAAEVAEMLPLMKVSDYLTYIAEVILEHVLALAWEQMVARHGRPRRADGSVPEQPDFVIVGYGKLGGIELGHGSDLDLVFIHNAERGQSTDGDRCIDNITFYTRLGQKIIHILNTHTVTGQLYEVDMRLRPSGNSGLLVTSLAAFEKYQLKEAWTWEHQALVRARVVAGCEELGKAFEASREKILGRPRDLGKLRADVVEMREKMREHLGTRGSEAKKAAQFQLKQDPGGIVDIEFMVQYAVLAWAHQVPKLMRWTDNIRILGCLEEADLLGADAVAQLIEAYKAYRSTGHRLALQRQSGIVEGSHFTSERQGVTRLWQQLLEN